MILEGGPLWPQHIVGNNNMTQNQTNVVYIMLCFVDLHHSTASA
jgi:hypothetical protein